MNHPIDLATGSFQGCFARERAPILTIDSGDTITGKTPDAGGGLDTTRDAGRNSDAWRARDLAG